MSEITGGSGTLYNHTIADLICTRLGDGQSLREICRDPAMPDKATVFRWLAQHDDFRQQYAVAREAQADHLLEEMLDIADDARNDWMVRAQGDDEIKAPDQEHISRSKLRISTRQWMMAKMAPKKYGDRIVQEHSGPDGAPIEVTAVTHEKRARALALILAKAKAREDG